MTHVFDDPGLVRVRLDRCMVNLRERSWLFSLVLKRRVPLGANAYCIEGHRHQARPQPHPCLDSWRQGGTGCQDVHF